MKRVVAACDHGGVEIKQRLVSHLENLGYEVVDLGVNDTVKVDYPDFAVKACDEFMKGGYEFGLLCCGTGIGISIAANKIRGIRCASLHDRYSAQMARRHNNLNFVAFGGRVQYSEPAESILDAFLGGEYEGGNHARRIEKVMALEERPS